MQVSTPRHHIVKGIPDKHQDDRTKVRHIIENESILLAEFRALELLQHTEGNVLSMSSFIYETLIDLFVILFVVLTLLQDTAFS